MNWSRQALQAALEDVGLGLSDRQLDQLHERVSSSRDMVRELEQTSPDLSHYALRPRWAAPAREDPPETIFAPGDGTTPFLLENPSSVSPVRSVQQALDAMDAHPDANVFTEVRRDQALEEARRLETEGPEDNPLWGSTVAIKDLMALRGRRMTGGSAVLDLDVDDRDATVVRRLRRAGAVVVGAANLHELAFGVTSVNPHFGTVKNPEAEGHLAGGSSGGSAAAVGYGMTTFALGTDTGGSVRIPASCCGVVGYKPSFNLLPLEGVFPLGYTLDHVGPLTRSVREAAVVTEVMTGRPGSLTGPASNHQKPDGVRVGVPEQLFLEELQPGVREVFESSLESLKIAGFEPVSVSLPHHSVAPAVYLGTSGTEAADIHFHRVIEHGDRMGEDVFLRLLAAQFLPAYAQVRAQRIRHQMYQELQDCFESVDILAVPTLPITPPAVGTSKVTLGEKMQSVPSALLRNTSPFNLTGVPALNLPVGTNENGLPVGLQLIGPYAGDRRLLGVAREMERLFPGSG